MCAGALIAPNWFLTAGHCEIVVGEYVDYNRVNMKKHEPFGERHQVVQKISHPEYNIHDLVTDLHDIQLVRLGTPARNTPLARLPTDEEAAILETPGMMLTVAGWGTLTSDPNADTVDHMREVQVPVVSNHVCGDTRHYGSHSPPWLPKKIYPTMLCAGVDEGGKDSCLGDSGAPLFAEIDGVGVIVGIVSWAVGCGKPLRPGVYTRVSAYRDWIQNTIAANDALPPAAGQWTGLSGGLYQNSGLGNYDYKPGPTNYQGPATCQNQCGLKVGDCYCDPSCLKSLDCCPDFEDTCGRMYKYEPSKNPTAGEKNIETVLFSSKNKAVGTQVSSNDDTQIFYGSCYNLCGKKSPLQTGGHCYCDGSCSSKGDCCDDYSTFCIAISVVMTPNDLSSLPRTPHMQQICTMYNFEPCI